MEHNRFTKKDIKQTLGVNMKIKPIEEAAAEKLNAKNEAICIQTNDQFICNMDNVSVDIDLGIGTWLALSLLLLFK